MAEEPFGNEELDKLAAELRQTVGREFRWEAEDVEQLTDQQRRRRRSISDVAQEAMSRGDVVLLRHGDLYHRGSLVAVRGDLAVLDTGAGLVNARLDGAILLVVEMARQGGTQGQQGAQSFRGRLAELEHTGEVVILEGEELELTGRIGVSAADHITLIDSEESEWFIPYSAIRFVIQPRR